MSRYRWQRAAVAVVGAISLAMTAGLSAQEPQAPTHDHMQMNMEPAGGWQLMQDGILFLEFNHQDGPRGGDEFVAPNWWMGMATRNTSRGRFTFTSMLSLDPASVGKEGYRLLFQSGETLNGEPLVDRQHPHDFFMQLGAVWRIPLNATTGFTLVGAPAGEPALGPVAFMHRLSAMDNPTAPLSHHTFDSTHISYGVVTAAIDHGRWLIEGSVFNGREPDENRWDFDFGRLDSVSGRVWFRPTPAWELQASTGHLKDPEALEPGNIQRSTASVGWTRTTGTIAAWTAGYGRNDTDHGSRNAGFLEGALYAHRTSLYSRAELVQVETPLVESNPTVFALTIGGVRDVFSTLGLEGGFGADVTFNGVPDDLRSAYGSHPVSFHLFFRLRPSAGAMGRMWGMRLSQPVSGHAMQH